MTEMRVQNMSLRVGQTLTIVGVPKPEATNFAVNVGPLGADVALHINARFDAHGDERAVVCNSLQGGAWCEEVRQGGFPFQHGEEFKLTITLTQEEFLVVLSDGSEIHFPNRLGLEKYQVMSFDEGVRVRSIEVK